MSLIFATQLSAVATLALAALALATAILALLAWRKQSREVIDQAEMLRLQAAEFAQLAVVREREALEVRRAQAVLVYMRTAWEDDEKELVGYVQNTSQQPVYDVTFRSPDPQKSATMLGQLMPGQELSHRYGNFHPIALTIMPRGQMPSVVFRDRAGIRWLTWPDGRLMDLGPELELREIPWMSRVDAKRFAEAKLSGDEKWIEAAIINAARNGETTLDADDGFPDTTPGAAAGQADPDAEELPLDRRHHDIGQLLSLVHAGWGSYQITACSCSALRHTFASTALAEGAPISEVPAGSAMSRS